MMAGVAERRLSQPDLPFKRRSTKPTPNGDDRGLKPTATVISSLREERCVSRLQKY
jgi:hypothetical protein